jgi:small subunit ribosomal protein S8
MTFLKNKGVINDSISDMLTRIRNANLAKKSSVIIPRTKLTVEIAKILEKEGFIENLQQSLESPSILINLKYRSKKVAKTRTKESCITNLKRLSKPGLRIYVNHQKIPRILAGTGIVILSTPSGLMTDREARSQGIGGELICSVW